MLKKLLFSHVSPLIKHGRKQPLEFQDLPELPQLWDPHHPALEFEDLNGDEGGKAFIRQIIRALKPQGKKLALLIACMLAFKMVSPILIHKLIESVGLATRGELSLGIGILFAVTLCLVQLVSAILGQHYVYHAVTSTQTAVKGINQRICRAILASTAAENKKGQVINRASADAELAGASLWAVGEVVQIVLTIFLTGSLLFYYLGTAAFAPLIMLALLMPLSRWFSGRFSGVQGDIMHSRDERVGRMTQYLEGIRVIKSFVWEEAVSQEIGKLRSQENKSWKRMAGLKSFSTASYLFASLLVALSAFAVYVLQGNTLTAATAFTCLTLFSYLEPCFRQLPKILGEVSSSFVAGDRIASLLKDSDQKHVERQENPASPAQAPQLHLHNLSVSYEDKSNALKDIELSIQSGESIAVIGSVGSGKSTLLKLILGELKPHTGSIHRPPGKVAYVPQDPFLFHASLQENILLSQEAADEDELNEALHASCLDHDLELMPAGLMTEIGEGGGNLSGGQRQRVNLARAAMHSPNLILMDDPLSALDPKTEKQIVERLIFGLWKNCTRIVTTHRLEHLKAFDRIIFLEDGKLIANGTFGELMFHCKEFKRFYFEHQKEEKEEKEKAEQGVKEEVKQSKVIKPSASVKTVEDEEQKVGGVALKLYWDYLRAMAGFSRQRLPMTLTLLLLTSLTAMLLPIFQNRWISQWTQSLTSGEAKSNTYYLLVYAGIGLLTTCSCAIQHFYWASKAIEASRSLHDNALKGILSTMVRFFDANPSGRILSRFSRDLDAVEKDLSWSLEDAFMALLSSIGAVFVMLAALPFMGLVVLPVLGLYWFLQHAYRSCMRETKRIMNKARSPRISSIKEVLDGAPVIRCYQAHDFFQKRFSNALSDYQKAFYGVVLINRWFSIRIPLASSLLSLTASVGVIFMSRFGGLSEGIAGMALVYAFRFWDSLNWTVRAFGEAEAQMTSVERLESLATLTPEGGKEEIASAPAIRGEIVFNNVVASYASHLPDVLKGTSFKVPAGTKVGVIGRTGAGKSTLFSLLHRFIESREGEIMVDKRDIKNIPLNELRESISTIPQNPILFAGSIRENLDPLNRYSDDELRGVLLKSHVNFLNRGLETRVSEGGNNFSRGQRQLLCLARALVRKAQVIIVDEATASIDGKTDGLIREILMEECPGVTVLVIAHKLQSVSRCDMIIEMRDGKVLGTSYPKVMESLLQKPNADYQPLLA